jgi:ribosomal protein L11 methyltransferase
MKTFFVYKIYAQPFNAEIISGLLWQFDISGLIEEDDHIKIFTSEDSNISPEEIENSLDKLKADNIISSFRIEKELLEDKNWNQLWEDSREVIRVSERIVIKPSFKNYQAGENEIVLTIDPKMSFGTGEHQSTKLVLRLLEKYVKKGINVLDVGSGTGILSIAAIKLGAENAIAIDVDETCFDNCKENCSVNKVYESIKVLTGEIKDVNEKQFDLILANIQKNVLIEIADEIKMRTRKGGIVILSGLLKEDEESVSEYYVETGFQFLEKSVQDEWIALVLQKE